MCVLLKFIISCYKATNKETGKEHCDELVEYTDQGEESGAEKPAGHAADGNGQGG